MKKTIVTCDRCGKTIKSFANYAIRENSARVDFWGVGVGRSLLPQRIDLCPKCAEEFVNYLERGEKS